MRSGAAGFTSCRPLSLIDTYIYIYSCLSSCALSCRVSALRMVTDVQLAIFANMLGVSLFLLVVLYHYVAVNNPKKLE